MEVDDEEEDPDYQPGDDPKQEFIAEDAELDEEDTFKIEKHVHVINLQEAGDYVVEIRQFVSCFGKVVRKSKVDVPREYRKLIHFMHEMVLKIRSYGPVEHVDEEAVFKMIVDPTCTAWRRALHSAKTGNSKDLQRIEERRITVMKSTEECEISSKEEMMDLAGPMEQSSEEQKKHVKDLIKRYWAHTSRAHEEAATAASILRLLADEVDEGTYTALINVGTRPLIMVHVPQMAKQATAMKLEQEHEERVEDMRNTLIEEIIREQNVPVPVDRWVNSSIMIQTQYLSACYFVYAEGNPKLNMTNKGVAEMFKLSPSNLHKLVSGKKYQGGSMGSARKASSLKKLEEHGKPMVQCTRKKTIKKGGGSSMSIKSGGRAGKAKSSKTVTVTKTTPHLIPLPFLDDKTPAAGTRGAHKKKTEEEDPQNEVKNGENEVRSRCYKTM